MTCTSDLVGAGVVEAASSSAKVRSCNGKDDPRSDPDLRTRARGGPLLGLPVVLASRRSRRYRSSSVSTAIKAEEQYQPSSKDFV